MWKPVILGISNVVLTCLLCCVLFHEIRTHKGEFTLLTYNHVDLQCVTGQFYLSEFYFVLFNCCIKNVLYLLHGHKTVLSWTEYFRQIIILISSNLHSEVLCKPQNEENDNYLIVSVKYSIATISGITILCRFDG